MNYAEKLARAMDIAKDAQPRVQERRDRTADNEIVREALRREQKSIAARAVEGYSNKYLAPRRSLKAVA
jgi:hypothetical protein